MSREFIFLSSNYSGLILSVSILSGTERRERSGVEEPALSEAEGMRP